MAGKKKAAGKKTVRVKAAPKKAPGAKRGKAQRPMQSDVRAWVVTVDMGLGHQRATYPLMEYAEGGIIAVGGSQASDPAEKKQWDRLRGMYEFLSRVRSVPVVGKPLFGILDALQSIPSFYPIRDRSGPSFQVRLLSNLIERGLCHGLIEKIQEQPLPLITSYFAPAIAADKADYGRIYCIICDAEVSRAWVPENPRKSRIHYLAPCGRAIMRLNQYGVPDERVFLTGFPFPETAARQQGPGRPARGPGPAPVLPGPAGALLAAARAERGPLPGKERLPVQEETAPDDHLRRGRRGRPAGDRLADRALPA